jgi:hypothetical protein
MLERMTDNAVLTNQEHKKLVRSVTEEKIADELYIRHHPEITIILDEVIARVLIRRPEEPVAFVEDFLATEDLHAIAKAVAKKASLRPH